MAPTSSKKVVSDSEAPAGTQKKLLTPEQRAKKQASDKKSRLFKKAKNSNTEERLVSVTKEREYYRGQLFNCEKTLEKAMDELKKAYSTNGGLIEQNRALLKQINDLEMHIRDTNKRWGDDAQNEEDTNYKLGDKLIENHQSGPAMAPGGSTMEEWSQSLISQPLGCTQPQQPVPPQPSHYHLGPTGGFGGSSMLQHNQSLPQPQHPVPPQPSHNHLGPTEGFDGLSMLQHNQSLPQPQQPVPPQPSHNHFGPTVGFGGLSMLQHNQSLPQTQQSIQSPPFETPTESGGYTMIELSKLHPQSQWLSKVLDWCCQHVDWSGDVWRKYISPSRSLLCWRLLHHKLPTDDALRRRGMILINCCRLCGEEIETMENLFFRCVFAKVL